MSTLPTQTPSRWKVMQALADHGPLDRKQLAEKTGVHPTVVRGTLLNPERARWITVTQVPTERGTSRKFLYEITDTGRLVLASAVGTDSEVNKRVAAVVPDVARDQRPKGNITGVDTETNIITIAWDNGDVTTERYKDLGRTWVYVPAATAKDTTP